LEEILARIETPRLDKLDIAFFNQIIFDTPQLFQFINRTPTLRVPETGSIVFHSKAVYVNFGSPIEKHDEVLGVRILCAASEWQLSSLEQVCTSSLPPVSTLEVLFIFGPLILSHHRNPLRWPDDVENMLWLDLFRSFVTLKVLYLSEEFVPRIGTALQELVGGGTTEVLSTLENIIVRGSGFGPSGPFHEGIEKFVAARQLTSHPVTVSRQDTTRPWLYY
jgi:hypothetical protein